MIDFCNRVFYVHILFIILSLSVENMFFIFK